MTDEDDLEPDDDPAFDDGGEDEELPFWESSARSRIRGILDTAEFDVEEGTVTLESDEWDPRGKGDCAKRTFSSLDELRQELIQLGDSEIAGHVPWEGGPVFSTDSDDLVDDALDEAGVYSFFRSLDVPDQSDLLLSAADLAGADQVGQIRFDLEQAMTFSSSTWRRIQR